MDDILDRLTAVLAERRQADPKESYVAALHAKGLNKILEKVGEEATETIIAAKDTQHSNAAGEPNTLELVKETADLWFHTMVMLEHLGATPRDVLEELDRRFGTSGLTEKAARST